MYVKLTGKLVAAPMRLPSDPSLPQNMTLELYLNGLQKRIDADYQEALKRFPKPGAKLRYLGPREFWFTSILANAERELEFGKVYTLKTIELASDWASVTLEETGDTEFASIFFEDLSDCCAYA